MSRGPIIEPCGAPAAAMVHPTRCYLLQLVSVYKKYNHLRNSTHISHTILYIIKSKYNRCRNS